MEFNLKSKNTIAAIVLLVLTVVVQFLPFVNTAELKSETEDFGKTWAELPKGISGEDRSSWPSEIKYGDFDTWEPEVQAKYPLIGKKDISIFQYVWLPAGALTGAQVNCYVLVQVMFIAFALFSFFVSSKLAQAVVSYMFGLSYVYAFVQTLILKGAGMMIPSMVTTVCLVVLAVLVLVYSVMINIEYVKTKKNK